jgi:hypothetical protein
MTKEKEAAGKGAEFMDSYMPDWYKKIDLDDLDIDSCVDCILGQLFGNYETGIKEVWGLGPDDLYDNLDERCKLGFTAVRFWDDRAPLLTAAWKKEIQDRLSEEVRA